MNRDIQLFACLCIGNGVLDVKSCQRLKKLLPDDVELLDFAQAILDNDIYEDFDTMQDLLDQAVEMGEAGEEPPFDPFADLKKAPGASRPSIALGNPPAEPEPEGIEPTTGEPVRPKISLRGHAQAEKTTEKPAPASAPKPELDPTDDPFAPAPPQDEGADDLAAMVSGLWAASGTKAPKNAVAGVDMDKVQPAPQVAEQAARALGKGEVAVSADQMAEVRRLVEELVVQTAKEDPAELGIRPKPRETIVKTEGAKPVWPDASRLDPSKASQMRLALIGLLLKAEEHGASDVHICAGSRLFIRRNRGIEYVSKSVVSAPLARAMCLSVLSKEQREYFEQEHDYDFAMPLDRGQRFRANLMLHKDGVEGTYRIVPSKIPTLEDLGFDPGGVEALSQMLAYHNGLVLVTGPVGSGKTTTLSAMVNIINQSRQDHVITVEEPIEVIQRSAQCQITQRGVGPHTKTFKSALKGALRQDPDIIVIGEMRDLETIEMAISASETGHLVIGTMHTSDAATTLNRLLDVFPPAQQSQIRAMVAESLRGILCQRLLPTTNGGVALVYELLLKNTAVSALIREGKSEGLSNIIETGRRDGMVQMDNSVMARWRAGSIDAETALANLRSEPMKMEVRNAGAPATSTPPAEPGKKGMFGR